MIEILQKIAVLAPVLILVEGCNYLKPPSIVVRNESALVVSNIVFSGSGFSHQVAVLRPGQSKRFSVHPEGEAGVTISFDSAHGSTKTNNVGYIEAHGGYRVEVIIASNLTVISQTHRSR